METLSGTPGKTKEKKTVHSETFEVVNFHDSLQLKLTKKKQDIQEEKKKGP